MLTKSVKSVISVELKHVAQAKKSVQSVRSVSDSNILLLYNKVQISSLLLFAILAKGTF